MTVYGVIDGNREAFKDFCATVRKLWCDWRASDERLQSIWDSGLCRANPQRLAEALKHERFADHDARQPKWKRIFEDVYEKSERTERNEFEASIMCWKRDMLETSKTPEQKGRVRNMTDRDVWQSHLDCIKFHITHRYSLVHEPGMGRSVLKWVPRDDDTPCLICGHKRELGDKRNPDGKTADAISRTFHTELIENIYRDDKPCGLGAIACKAARAVQGEKDRWVAYFQELGVEPPNYLTDDYL